MKKYALISTILFISLAVLVSSCAKKPEAELQRAESALAAAKDAGAPDLAPSDYQAAENKLNEGKKQYDKQCYKKAKPILEEAANLADIAKQKALAAKQPTGTCPCAAGTCPATGPCAAGTCPATGPCPATCTCPAKQAPPATPGQPSKPVVAPTADNGLYTVKKGDCLWNISKKQEIYADPYLWPLIYNENKDKIKKSPDLIFPKQVFTINKNPTDEQINKAWKKTGKPKVKAEAAVKPKVKKAKEAAAPKESAKP